MESPSDSGSEDLLIGLRVGNHVIERRIGQGGMGSVYLARHPDLGTKIAIKVLAAGAHVGSQAADRFLAEARAASQIDHSSVIQIHDFGRLPTGGLYYTMEALQGRELGAIIDDDAPMEPAGALAYLEQICPALHAAHGLGIVHRDLKPSNIFVVSDEPLQLKLLDFGIAKLLHTHHPDARQTISGAVMGTPEFMAPEQAAGHTDAVCPQTDIYALGVIAYLMLSGQLPISADNPSTLLHKQITAPPTPIRELRDEIPPALARAIHRCLEKDPAARPADAVILLQQLQAAIVAVPAATAPRSCSARVIPDRPRRPDAGGDTVALAESEPTALASSLEPAPTVALAETDPTARAPFQRPAPTRALLPRQRVAIWIAAAALVLVGSGAWYLVSVKVGDVQEPIAPGQRRPAARQPATHTVNVTGAENLRCSVWIDGTPVAVPACDQLEVPRDRRVKLSLVAPGVRPFSESWVARSDRTIHLAAASPAPSRTPVTNTGPTKSERAAPNRSANRSANKRSQAAQGPGAVHSTPQAPKIDDPGIEKPGRLETVEPKKQNDVFTDL